MIPEHELQRLKEDNPCDARALKYVAGLRRQGKKLVGPCPVCGGAKGNERFMATAEEWRCAACCDGGDVIALVMRVENVDFLAACRWLGWRGQSDAGGKETGPYLGAEAGAGPPPPSRGRKEAADDNVYRENERARLFDIWRRAKPAAGTVVEEYLKLRRLQLPEGCRLRLVEDMPFFAHGAVAGGRAASGAGARQIAPVLHRGPAMVAAGVNQDGRFTGLHLTWIDLKQPNGKALIIDPETGEPRNPKKMRGTKLGCAYELVKVEAGLVPLRLIVGEGIETVLSAWLALSECGVDVAYTEFWAAGDLGNLAGKAAATIAHPTRRTETGRPARVPGPDAAPDAVGFMAPAAVREVVLLADGDSDPVLTRCAMYRAQQRLLLARSPSAVGQVFNDALALSVRVAWPAQGMDFNDMLRASADEPRSEPMRREFSEAGA